MTDGVVSLDMTDSVVSFGMTDGVGSSDMTDGAVSLEMTDGVGSSDMSDGVVSSDMSDGVVDGQEIPQIQLEPILVEYPDEFIIGSVPRPTGLPSGELAKARFPPSRERREGDGVLQNQLETVLGAITWTLN